MSISSFWYRSLNIISQEMCQYSFCDGNGLLHLYASNSEVEIVVCMYVLRKILSRIRSKRENIQYINEKKNVFIIFFIFPSTKWKCYIYEYSFDFFFSYIFLWDCRSALLLKRMDKSDGEIPIFAGHDGWMEWNNKAFIQYRISLVYIDT